jgi:quinol monooxygenase YgiN
MEQIIAGVFEVDPADREAWLASREPLVRRSRAEPGCITYVFAPDPIEPGVVQLFERWADEEALEAHRQVLASDPPADPGVTLKRSDVRYFAATELPR